MVRRQPWYGMTRLLDAGYVNQAGDMFWLTPKGLKLIKLLEDDDMEQTNRPSAKRVRCVSFAFMFLSWV
jgi:hypothetical protein